MRYAVRCSTCALFWLLTTTLVAQETKAPWWKFGRGQDAPAAQATVTPAPTLTPAPETITPVEEDSWLAWPSMPKWHWPEFAANAESSVSDGPVTSSPSSTNSSSRPRAAHSRFGKPTHQRRPRNTWAQQPASTSPTGEAPSTWQTMKASTRHAWDKTIDFVTPGDDAETSTVASEKKSSWWQRMWGSEERKEGPQTVTEWMAQDRIDP